MSSMNVALNNLLLGLSEKYLALSMSVTDKRFEVTSHQTFPTNSNMGYPSVCNGVVTFNAADATYNSATAGAGQRLVGIVGQVDFSFQGSLSSGSSLSMSVNYTNPQQIAVTSALEQLSKFDWAVLYIYLRLQLHNLQRSQLKQLSDLLQRIPSNQWIVCSPYLSQWL